MDTVIRALSIYFILLLLFRLTGKRTLAQITTFDFVLLLILGEATQQALIGNDFSITTGALLIVTLVGVEVALSLLARRLPGLKRFIDGLPLVIVEDGRLLRDRLEGSRVDESDILSAARKLHGLERLDQVKYAVLEPSGGITVVPRDDVR